MNNGEYNVRTPERTSALEKIQHELGLSPMENPFEYVKALQADFDGSRLRFDEEDEENGGFEFESEVITGLQYDAGN